MENLDIIILSTILTTLFAIFIGFTAKELMKEPKVVKPSDESGPRVELIKFVGRLFDSPDKSNEEANSRILMYKSLQRTISDMEQENEFEREKNYNSKIELS